MTASTRLGIVGASGKKTAKSVQSYSEALDWLFVHTPVDTLDAVVHCREELTSAMHLVLDIYWISEAKLVRDMYKRWYPERFGPCRECF